MGEQCGQVADAYEEGGGRSGAGRVECAHRAAPQAGTGASPGSQTGAGAQGRSLALDTPVWG